MQIAYYVKLPLLRQLTSPGHQLCIHRKTEQENLVLFKAIAVLFIKYIP